ncbi:MAG: coiled-coil domain-containing protein [Nitrospirota bacterium]
MSSLAFDTLEYVQKLKAVGVPEKQAEAHAHALSEVIESNLATKQDTLDLKRDIANVRAELKRDIAEVKAELKRDIAEVKAELKRDIKELELKFSAQFVLLKWMMGVILAGILSLVLKAFFMP